MNVGNIIILSVTFGWLVGYAMGRVYQAHLERQDRMRSAASEKAAWAAATECHEAFEAYKRNHP